MALTLTAAQLAEIAKKVKAPKQLIEIDLDGDFIRLATGDTITWDGKTFVKSGLKVSSVKTGKAGVQTCRIEIIDTDHIFKELILSTGFIFREVTYWKVYGEQPYAAGDPIKAFNGEIISVPKMKETVMFNCMTTNAAQRKAPIVLLGPPEVKHMPRPGQKILIGREMYTVEFK